MVNDARWLLPEGVEEILPEEAQQLELLRRSILDDMSERGFKLVMPPVMEFVDSLLTGTGEELDTQTYKFMDQHTQRMLGIRADITPQVARIDAHYLDNQTVNRLCYAGTVLRTRPTRIGEQRELLQIGVELFGEESETADIEVIDAMLAALSLAEADQITLSIGHVGIYRALLQKQNIDAQVESSLHDILLRKSLPDLQELGDRIDIKPFESLLKLAGGEEVTETVLQSFADLEGIKSAVAQLQAVIEHCKANHSLNLHIDLADVAGYRYHTGLMYTAFISGRGRSVAQGGRYDRIGQQFGRARPATGYSADLKTLVKLKQLKK